MKKVFLTFITASVLSVFCHAGKPAAYSPEIAPYVKFIQQCDTDPVDYVMGLFDKYDIVILGERDHRDTTQYDLIKRIISDQRFIDKVGHIITEVGANNMSANANRIINADMTDDEFYQAFVKHLRNVDMDVYWEKYNFYQLHRDIRAVNKQQDDNHKLKLTYAGTSFIWDDEFPMTTEEYAVVDNYSDYNNYDKILAENAINKFGEIWCGDGERKKALIIFNRPHSYRQYPLRGDIINNPFAAQIIMDRFPGHVTNIMLNTRISKYDDNKRINAIIPIQNGKWDAAFKVCGYKSIGFDFTGSPFGADAFDHYDKPLEPTAYQDVFDGFIYYLPIDKFVISSDYDGFIDDGFEAEFYRRARFIATDEETVSEIERLKSTGTNSQSYNEEYGLECFNDMVNQYITQPGTEKGK